MAQDLINTREVGEFLSGALAGAMTKAVLAPLETIRCVFLFDSGIIYLVLITLGYYIVSPSALLFLNTT